MDKNAQHLIQSRRTGHHRATGEAQAITARLRLLLGFVFAMYLGTHFSCTGTFGCGHAPQTLPSR